MNPDHSGRAELDARLEAVSRLKGAGRLGQAHAMLGEAGRLWPESGEVELELGSVAVQRWSLLVDSEGRARDDDDALRLARSAREHFRRARSLEPALACESMLREAVIEFRYDFRLAVRLCLEAEATGQDAALAIGYRANFLAEAEHFEEAEALFEKALDIDQEHLTTLLNYGRLQIRKPQPDFGFAAFLFRRAIEIDPTSVEGHFRLGDILGSIPGSLETAAEHLREALRLDPSHVEARRALGDTLRVLNEEPTGD